MNKGHSPATAWTTYDLEPTKALIPGHYYANSVIPGCTNVFSKDWKKSNTHDCSQFLPKKDPNRYIAKYK